MLSSDRPDQSRTRYASEKTENQPWKWACNADATSPAKCRLFAGNSRFTVVRFSRLMTDHATRSAVMAYAAAARLFVVLRPPP